MKGDLRVVDHQTEHIVLYEEGTIHGLQAEGLVESMYGVFVHLYSESQHISRCQIVTIKAN